MSIARSLDNLQAGDIFNQRWQIIKKLGQGGFGAVYQALDLNIEDRQVAIKLLTVDTTKHPEALTRFKKEASITSKLRSQNILMIYDFGVIDQYAYMISELLVGETVAERISQHRYFTIEEALNIIKCVAVALSEAHQSNIVHRDIKPDNIFLNRTKDGYEVKLIDFGIAKVMEASTKLTVTQGFFGTPLYVSPEQIKDTSKVDPRTDIYSLGLVLYACIVGKPPFEAEDFYLLLKKQVEENVPKINFNQNKQYEPINDLIMRMTHKDPNHRIQNIKEVIDQISRIQAQINHQSLNVATTLKDAKFKFSFLNQPKILKWFIVLSMITIGTIIVIKNQNQPNQIDLNQIDLNQIDIHEDTDQIDMIVRDQLIPKIELNPNHQIDEINEIKKPQDEIKKPQDPKSNQPPIKINTAMKNKSMIHALIETKMLGIKTCIHLYQADFEHDFLNLNLDFQDGSLYRLHSSSLNDQTKLCIKNIIEKLDFSSEMMGGVNLHISLPED